MAAIAFAQSADRHLTSADSQALFRKSTYAHGYMHGYEDGFHDADIDIHMGRGERAVSQIEDFKACTGYQKGFGDKRFFRDGYRQGFTEGYGDGINRREFRAIAGARKAAEGLTPSTDASVGSDFDEAFSRGYDSGRKVGPDTLRNYAESDYAFSLCESKTHSKQTKSQEYCDAFSRGFSLGAFDASEHFSQPGMQTARKTSDQRPPR